MKTIQILQDLSGRSALVTGGAGYIGLCICETLMELGANVSVVDLDEDACRKRVSYLNALGRPGKAFSIPGDLSSPDETRTAVQNSAKIMGGMDILVHAAAFVGTTEVPGWAVPFEQQTLSAWDAAIRINLSSVLILAQAARDCLTSSGRGSIILISSIYGMVGPDYRLYANTSMEMPAGYAASKGGLLQLSRYLATVMAPAVRVNTISAGGIFRNQPEVFVNRYIERTPLKRMGTEEDLKGAVAFLAGDSSSYVTGSNLVLDGGWTAW